MSSCLSVSAVCQPVIQVEKEFPSHVLVRPDHVLIFSAHGFNPQPPLVKLLFLSMHPYCASLFIGRGRFRSYVEGGFVSTCHIFVDRSSWRRLPIYDDVFGFHLGLKYVRIEKRQSLPNSEGGEENNQESEAWSRRGHRFRCRVNIIFSACFAHSTESKHYPCCMCIP